MPSGLSLLHSGVIRRILCVLAGCVALGLWMVPVAWGQPTTSQDIHSAGPLTDIYAGQDLSCQVAAAGDSSTEFYPGGHDVGDCGTFLAVDYNDDNDISAELFGPDFADHADGTATPFPNNDDYTPFSETSQSPITGSGTADDPYTVITAVEASENNVDATVTQTDTYVVGQDFYTSSVTVHNDNSTDGGKTFSGQLFHAGDCFLRGFDTGLGALEPSTNSADTAACSVNSSNSPPSALEEFVPQTDGNAYVEDQYGTASNQIWGAVDGYQDLPDSCDCATNEDNAMGIDWSYSVDPGEGPASFASFTWETKIDAPPITVTAGHAFGGQAPTTVNGAVASFSDSDVNTTADAYTATVNWGDGSSDQNATITGSNGNFTVSDNHTYTTPGSYTITVTVGYNANPASDQSANDTATVAGTGTGPPSPVVTGPPTVKSSTSSAFSGSANPNGLPTTVRWEYGLDASDRGPGFSGYPYDQTTPSQQIGSDFSSHGVAGSASNLQPNSLYHVRLVATNSDGTKFGRDVTFRTPAAPSPPAPTLGKTENFTPVGSVFILINGKFVKLTQGRQLPSGTEVDALHGSLELVAAGLNGHGYTGTFGGAVFKVVQTRFGANKGLTTLSIVEGAFKGAPSYASCKAKGAADGSPVAQAALSRRVLQTLRSRSSGRFSTRGRYAAGTVRGTRWTTSDRCNGTLIAVQLHSVLVTDLVKHITILIKAGHSYLARAPK